jgi:hypothetical protein
LKLLSPTHLTRVGGTALLAAGVLLATVAPASAAAPGTDFAVTLTGTTIAADTSGKFGSVTVANVGTATSERVELRFDLADLDLSKVEVDLTECDREGDEIRCLLADEFVPKPGAGTDLDLPISRRHDATGAAGTLTVSVKADGDTESGNDTVTANVTVGTGGVDLNVVAEDVYAIDDAGELTDRPVARGEVAALVGHVLNQGDMTAQGIKVSVKLPKGATFAEKLPECTYAAGNRSAACTFTRVDLIPADLDTEDYLLSGADFWFFVKVAADAKAPVLKNGLFSAAAMKSVAADSASIKSLRKHAPKRTAAVRNVTVSAVKDVDDSDNTDEFSVFVAPEVSGGSGGGGGLPVTGPQAAVLGGGGLVVAVAGALLFLLARRRRVVLVTPGDERAPTG